MVGWATVMSMWWPCCWANVVTQDVDGSPSMAARARRSRLPDRRVSDGRGDAAVRGVGVAEQLVDRLVGDVRRQAGLGAQREGAGGREIEHPTDRGLLVGAHRLGRVRPQAGEQQREAMVERAGAGRVQQVGRRAHQLLDRRTPGIVTSAKPTLLNPS